MLDIYKKQKEEALEKSFAQPGAVFRGAPFWSWNTRLDIPTLQHQIEVFKEMGIGGFHMHSRVGLDTPYLGAEFMDCVKACVEKARQEDMLAWLYDEDRWPSGAAGGLVTKDPQYRIRVLLFLPQELAVGKEAERVSSGTFLAAYAVTLNEGRLASGRLLKEGEKPAAGEQHWLAYLVQHAPSSWYNNQSYLDTLNPEAVEKFIEITHEGYKKEVGKDFGTLVPGIFTDEPQFSPKDCLSFPGEQKALSIPYTDDFPQTYRAAYGTDFLPTLPEIFWELPEGNYSSARYRYHDHVTERFAAAFADTIGNWCVKNNICFTGHMMEEPTLWSQTHMIGEAMRSYRSFQIPGIDMLCDGQEFTTAKQAQSATHQYGCSGVLSELYGVTGWDYDFAGHKSQGDWQAALGVTVRVHHLSWVSMKGEAKRDYPASIFYQSPWYKRYRVVEDHFARVNAALVRGTPRVRIGMLHPIESYWLAFGPVEQTAVQRGEMEENFRNAIHWLLEGQLDFDYLCESLLPQQCPLDALQTGKGFPAGKMRYDAIVVPPMLTMRSSTLERLQAFRKTGGRVLFAGAVATLVDGIPSQAVRDFAAACEQVSFTRGALTEALEDLREVDIRKFNNERNDGERIGTLLYQMRQDGADRILFVCNTDRRGGTQSSRISLPGEWAAELLDTQTGAITPLAADYADGKTLIEYTFFAHGHLLLRLRPGRREQGTRLTRQIRNYGEEHYATRLPERCPITLSEPNVLLLDQAAWRTNGGEWQPQEEILRIGNHARNALGINKDGGFSGGMTQPWCTPEDKTVCGVVELCFTIHSDIAVAGAKLAVELAENEELFFDSKPVQVKPEGWWVDEALQLVQLPDFAAGRHELVRKVPLQRKYSLEWSYLLGDFGVQVAGRVARLTAPVRDLVFGDITRQGLPFYTGNIAYHCAADVPVNNPVLEISQFNGAMVDVQVNGRSFSPIAYAPYRCVLEGVSKGKHDIELLYYGTRGNAFNPLHWATPRAWVGPHAWRTGGAEWCYEYKLHEAGILIAPALAIK